MAAERFKIVEVNPNDSVGGAGCLCGEAKPADCKGPFAVFYTDDMASNMSPHAVLCAGCAVSAARQLSDSTDVLVGGESAPEIEGDAVELEEPDEIPEV